MNIEKVEKQITNPELVEAIKAMRKEFSAETQNKVLNLALQATFLVPCVVSKDTQLVADENNHVQFEEKPQVKFVLIQNENTGTFFPAFTDAEELAKFQSEEPYQPFGMKFTDLAMLSEQTPNINGFVLNPFSDNLPFTKELLADMKAALMKHREKMQGNVQ
ncbi:MAG: SseB family protein [Ruminococcus sp.]|nr:SseB family protein [Ruminococcus sp.]